LQELEPAGDVLVVVPAPRVEVVAPAGQLEAVVPPPGREAGHLFQRQVGPLAGEQGDRSCHFSSVAGYLVRGAGPGWGGQVARPTPGGVRTTAAAPPRRPRSRASSRWPDRTSARSRGFPTRSGRRAALR